MDTLQQPFESRSRQDVYNMGNKRKEKPYGGFLVQVQQCHLHANWPVHPKVPKVQLDRDFVDTSKEIVQILKNKNGKWNAQGGFMQLGCRERGKMHQET
ncbi:hypothetical protein Tco_0157232 [Tanacetum coccineum]